MDNCEITTATSNNVSETGFISGGTFTFFFDMYDEQNEPLNLRNSTGRLYIAPFGQPTDVILSIDGSWNENTPNRMTFKLLPNHTSSLSGIYIHQLEITDYNGNKYRPTQGLIKATPSIRFFGSNSLPIE